MYLSLSENMSGTAPDTGSRPSLLTNSLSACANTQKLEEVAEIVSAAGSSRISLVVEGTVVAATTVFTARPASS